MADPDHTMRIAGRFNAESREEAAARAREWADAEPNLESYEIVAVEEVTEHAPWQWKPRDLWDVTFDLQFK